MSEIAASAKGLRLSPARIEQFHETGYLKNLPLLDQEGIATLQREFMELVDRVPDTVDIYRVNNWHKANRWFYELGRIPAVLDYVEDLLGPDPTTNRRFPGTRMPGTGPSNRGKPSPSGSPSSTPMRKTAACASSRAAIAGATSSMWICRD